MIYVYQRTQSCHHETFHDPYIDILQKKKCGQNSKLQNRKGGGAKHFLFISYSLIKNCHAIQTFFGLAILFFFHFKIWLLFVLSLEAFNHVSDIFTPPFIPDTCRRQQLCTIQISQIFFYQKCVTT